MQLQAANDEKTSCNDLVATSNDAVATNNGHCKQTMMKLQPGTL